MKTMSALESQGENIERWEEVVDGINQVKRLHDNIFLKNVKRQGILKVFSLTGACKTIHSILNFKRTKLEAKFIVPDWEIESKMA